MVPRKLSRVSATTPVGTRVAWVNLDFIVVLTRTRTKPESVHGDFYVGLTDQPGLFPAQNIFVLTDKDLELA